MSLKIGDVIHNGKWMTGDEPEWMKKKYEKEVTSTIDDLCEQEGAIHGPIRVLEKHPMDHDVPEVPDHIQGSKVRMLVVEATVVELLLTDGEGSFVDNLEPKDIIKLRKITRRVIYENSRLMISDEECDEVIEELGEDAALDALRKNTLRIVH